MNERKSSRLVAEERLFQRNLSSLDPFFEMMDAFIGSVRVDADTAADFKVAAEELFTNAIRHSGASRTPIGIQLSREDDWLEFRLTDQGAEPFDITTAPLSDLSVPIEQRQAGGMGLHIVRAIADELSYTHQNGNGIITLRKKLR
ncbi:MAG: ATP-binding protein [candidate division Zixibacteria bacterium]|nr:ATP-binding protein [candidate division Zixibacteria bacterium]